MMDKKSGAAVTGKDWRRRQVVMFDSALMSSTPGGDGELAGGEEKGSLGRLEPRGTNAAPLKLES